jgi:hypothetical protein
MAGIKEHLWLKSANAAERPRCFLSGNALNDRLKEAAGYYLSVAYLSTLRGGFPAVLSVIKDSILPLKLDKLRPSASK